MNDREARERRLQEQMRQTDRIIRALILIQVAMLLVVIANLVGR